MSGRDLVVLGTASQAPTRDRNHNGYLLRWDGYGILFDPGEGTQRQMALAGVPSSAIDLICLTHLHGDHCLGLPGILARMSLDGRVGPLEVLFPAPSAPEVSRLLGVVVGRRTVQPVAVACEEGMVAEASPAGPSSAREKPPFRLSCRWLDHTIPTLGWRLDEPPGRTMDRGALDRAGIRGPAVGELIERGSLTTDRGTFYLDDLSRPRRGQSFAFVMDTRASPAVVELARGVDVLVCESTFRAGDEALAGTYGHLTATQAATLAAQAGARFLVLTHFSQRYTDERGFAQEAARIFPNVVAVRDLDVVPFPARAERP